MVQASGARLNDQMTILHLYLFQKSPGFLSCSRLFFLVRKKNPLNTELLFRVNYK